MQFFVRHGIPHNWFKLHPNVAVRPHYDTLVKSTPGRQTHEVRIKRMSSAQPVGTFSVRRPFQLLCMLKTCHRIDPTSPDEERISPHVTRRQAYKQRMRTDTNGSKIGVYVSRPLVLSGKVWHPFYHCAIYIILLKNVPVHQLSWLAL